MQPNLRPEKLVLLQSGVNSQFLLRECGICN